MRGTRFHSGSAFGRFLLAGGLFGLLVMAGCGKAKYEERLKRTADFYSYLTTMNSNLGAAWIRQDVGMSMRPPLPFGAPLPGPVTTKDEEGKVTVSPDPRQMNPLGVPLPGLIEAWEGNLDTSKQEPDVWMYVLSNYNRFQEEADGGRPANEFLVDLERELMSVFQVTVPDGETSQVKVNSRYRANFPPTNSPGANYTTPKDYSVIQFVGEFPVQDKELDGLLYERRVEKTQAAILVVLPKNASNQFRQRVEMALGTWSVDNVVPKGNNSSSPGTGGRAGRSGF